MRLEPLFEMRVERSQAIRVGPLTGPEGSEWVAWGTGEGSVSGDLIKGTLRACNHPRHRPDDVNLPDVHGVITTDDGETIYYELHGFGLAAAERVRRVVGSLTFRTASEPHARLNTAQAVVEGSIGEGAGGTAVYQVYECVPEQESATRRRVAARAFLAYFENPAEDPLDDMLTPDCVIHVGGPGEKLPGGAAGARALNERVSAFAESHWHFEDEIGEGDRLVLRTVNASVQHGVWNGLPGKGRTVSFPVVWTFRFSGDRIAEVWRTADDLSRVRQLGGKIIPA